MSGSAIVSRICAYRRAPTSCFHPSSIEACASTARRCRRRPRALSRTIRALPSVCPPGLGVPPHRERNYEAF